MFVVYLCIFECLGVKVIFMKVDIGFIGGDLSYEFILLVEIGESEVFCD